MISSDNKYHLKLRLHQSGFMRKLLGRCLLSLAAISFKAKRFFVFSRILGKYEKLNEGDILKGRILPLYKSLSIKRAKLIEPELGRNQIYTDFLCSSKAKSIAQFYKTFSLDDSARIRYKNEDDDDREGNLLIIKPPAFNNGQVVEKGVLYLQYNNSVAEFAQLFDVERLYRDFVLIFEPSSWGYTDLGLELLLHKKQKLYVMAQDEIDFNLCQLLDSRIVPIRAGAGDWINLDLGNNSCSAEMKKFDVCMIASWRKMKNHKLLFQELAKLGKGLRIALVGYCWENRTAASIRAEQKQFFPDSLVSIFESVPHEYVFTVLSQSKVALMLSEREGANRGIYEALASGTPVVMLKNNRGVNKRLVDEGCIFLSDAHELAETVKKMLIGPPAYSVKDRLYSVSGAKNTWNTISNTLSAMEGIKLQEEPLIVSTPNLKYVNAKVKADMEAGYNHLQTLLRPR